MTKGNVFVYLAIKMFKDNVLLVVMVLQVSKIPFACHAKSAQLQIKIIHLVCSVM